MTTYGDISARTAEWAALDMLKRAPRIELPPFTRWQRARRFMRVRVNRARWWAADRIHRLADWIEG